MADRTYPTGKQLRKIRDLGAERNWEDDGNGERVEATAAALALITARLDLSDPTQVGIGWEKEISEKFTGLTGIRFDRTAASNLIGFLQGLGPKRDRGDSDDEAAVEAQKDHRPQNSNKVAWDNVKRQIKEAGRKKSDGFYELPDGRIYKVVLAIHGSGELYAKQLIVHEAAIWGEDEDGAKKLISPAVIEWDYSPGAMRDIRPEFKMNEEQARAYGALYGRCYECSTPLTNELSIALGIGPICGSREFGGEFKQTVYAMEKTLGIRNADGKKIRKAKSYK
jgi:hypothetical protein